MFMCSVHRLTSLWQWENLKGALHLCRSEPCCRGFRTAPHPRALSSGKCYRSCVKCQWLYTRQGAGSTGAGQDRCGFISFNPLETGGTKVITSIPFSLTSVSHLLLEGYRSILPKLNFHWVFFFPKKCQVFIMSNKGIFKCSIDQNSDCSFFKVVFNGGITNTP